MCYNSKVDVDLNEKGWFKLKRILSTALACACLLSAFGSAVLPASAQDISAQESGVTYATHAVCETEYGNWVYDVENGGVTIIRFEYNSKTYELSDEFRVPDYIRSKPVLKIGESALKNLTFVKKVVLPDTVKIIGPFAFRGCKSLEEINLSSVTEIGRYAFSECNLKAVDFAHDIAHIETDAFAGNAQLDVVELKSDNENGLRVDWDAFANTGIKSLIVGPNVMLESSVFRYCYQLKSAELESPLYGASLFFDCNNLESVVLSADTTNIPASTFEGCESLKTLEINTDSDVSGITEIETSAFSGCKSLKSLAGLKLAKLTHLHSNVFLNCESLENLDGLDLSELKMVRTKALSGCKSLKSIDLGSVYVIDANAFDGSGLAEIYIDGNADRYYIDRKAFENSSAAVISDVYNSYLANYCDKYDLSYRAIDNSNEPKDSDSDIGDGVGSDDSDTKPDDTKPDDTKPDDTKPDDTKPLKHKRGDVDFDGATTSADALLVLRQSVGLEHFTEEQKELSDIDRDGAINSLDSLLILRASVGLENLEKY